VKVIEADDTARRQLGLHTPALEELLVIRAFKRVKMVVYHGILQRHGIMENTPATNPRKIRRKELRRKKMMAKMERRRGQPSVGVRRVGFGDDQTYPPARVGNSAPGVLPPGVLPPGESLSTHQW